MFTYRETQAQIEIYYHMHTGTRVFFGLIALIPLLAPYELILKTRWQNLWNLFFVFSAVICLGALALSAFLLWAALAGLSTRLVFDREGRTFTVTQFSPLIRPRPAIYALSAIQSITVDQHDWSDSAPDFSLLVTLTNGQKFSSGTSSSRAEIEQYRQRVLAFLGWMV
jgi:hypothetical protein